MAPAADREGFWGPTTSTLDWCEENYSVTWYIAEFCSFLPSSLKSNLKLVSTLQASFLVLGLWAGRGDIPVI
ncbi:ACER3 isoform 12 [Pongo abelii]|uniref:Alkaline ceramidase n=1 Tax=Pongo abelii TaxID=9601 RepID=A0A2J8V0Y2_PONAB|nr:ACER3 isoform 12 [Pongo abelii]